MKWLDVTNYEGIYMVSENGDIKRVAQTNNQYGIGHILKHNIINGYAHVQLHKNGIVKSKRVHRLVAEAFIDNATNKPHVNHKDGNKLNNHVSNLEWCTPSENELHKHRVLNKTHRKYVLTSEQINQICKLRIEGKRLHELSYMFKVPIDTIHKVLKQNNIKTGYSGMYNGQSKLTNSQRNEIVDLYNAGEKYTNISKKFNVSPITIKRVVANYSYEKTY